MLVQQRPLSTYDLLKTAMIVIMIVDHIGYFFFPDDLTWRAVGRWGAPAWFFLAGYAARRGKSDLMLWLAAALMTVMKIFVLGQIWPLTILLNLALARAFAAYSGDFFLRQPILFIPLFIVTAAGNAPLYPLLEYGALPFMFGIWGYMARNAHFKQTQQSAYLLSAAAIVFFISQQIDVFSFTLFDTLIMAGGTLSMYAALLAFRPYPIAGAGFLTPVIAFCGRQTLPIYIVHYLAFGIIAAFFRA